MIHLLPRALFLLITLYHAWTGDVASTVMYTGVLLATLPLVLLARATAWRRVEVYVMCMFVVFALIWQTPLQTWGIDKAFHVAGGFGLALAGMALYAKHLRGWLLATAVVAFALAAGAAWEVFEYLISLPPVSMHHWGVRDTVLDLVADTVGAYIMVMWTRTRT